MDTSFHVMQVNVFADLVVDFSINFVSMNLLFILSSVDLIRPEASFHIVNCS